MTDCKPVEWYLKHIQWWMYELPWDYESIVNIVSKWVTLTEYEKLEPRIVRFCAELPNELGCPKVVYFPQDKVCEPCSCE